MSGLALAVDWERPDPGEEVVRRMLGAMPHRAPEGSSVVSAPHCVLGFALRATTARERVLAQPHHDARRGYWIAGDARIDNREDLAAALGVKVPPSDVELLVLGYERWGEELAGKLYGDFAFAIWDERRRTLYAARDAFGMRPLFFHQKPSRLLVASEVDALLATREFAWEIDDATVADYLANSRYRDTRRTFFRALCRLPPGHALVATAERVRATRYFHFPGTPCTSKDAAGDVAEFRCRFRRAVADRLEADRPIFSELSGGLDSTSIACMADEVYREEGAGRPPLTLASALFPDLPCDERAYIEAVVRRLGLRSETWDGTAASPIEPDVFPLAYPWRNLNPGGSARARLLARAAGGRVLLSGAGGDQLLHEVGAFDDLARHGRLLRLARETLLPDLYTAGSSRRYFLTALRAAVPRGLRLAYRRLRPAHVAAPPPWLGTVLRRAREALPAPADPAPSRTQELTWSWLNLPASVWHLELAELEAARDGLQLRCPYYDRGLAEWVLSIPWERRLPEGRIKRLLRDAMAGALPREVAERRAVTTFNELVVRSVAQLLPLIASVLEGERWECGRYIVQREARRLVTLMGSSAASPSRDTCRDLWKIATIEWWMRALAAAGNGRESMAEIPAVDRSSSDGERRPAVSGYEPPRVERLGSLRELLGKTGQFDDSPIGETGRPNA